MILSVHIHLNLKGKITQLAMSTSHCCFCFVSYVLILFITLGAMMTVWSRIPDVDGCCRKRYNDMNGGVYTCVSGSGQIFWLAIQARSRPERLGHTHYYNAFYTYSTCMIKHSTIISNHT